MNWVVLPDLRRRRDLVEYMDDPGCDPCRLARTLDAFHRSNRLYGRYRHILGRWLLSDMLQDPRRAYRLADLGAGGCDIAVWLLGECRRRNLRLEVRAVEHHSQVIAYARQRYGNITGLEIRVGNALDIQTWADVDYVWANHFIHHLAEEELVEFFRRLRTVPLRRFIFSDVARSRTAYLLHSLIAPLLFPRTFVAPDGRTSLQRAFTPSELRASLHRAGWGPEVGIHSLWPARLVVVGSRSSS